MKPKLKKVALEFFDFCTPEVRSKAFVFMSAQISARDMAHVSYAPNEEIRTADCMALFAACTYEERLKTFSFVLDLWIEANKIPQAKADTITKGKKHMQALPAKRARALA